MGGDKMAKPNNYMKTYRAQRKANNGEPLGGGKANIKNSQEYKDAYDDEVERIKNFPGAIALEDYMTDEAIAYEMRVYKEMTGKSMVADLQSEIDYTKQVVKENRDVGKAYGASEEVIQGIGDANKATLERMNKAMDKLKSLRSDYESQVKREKQREARAKRRTWL
jgi:hypothetical protein